MIKRFVKILLVLIFAIPCIIYDGLEAIWKLVFYDSIVYIVKGISREDFSGIELKGMNFLLKILEI